VSKPTSYLRRLYVPLTISLIAIVAFTWYEFVWVASQTRYSNDRNLSLLGTLAGQIQQKVDSFDKSIDNAVAAGNDSSENIKGACRQDEEPQNCLLGLKIQGLVRDLVWVSKSDAAEASRKSRVGHTPDAKAAGASVGSNERKLPPLALSVLPAPVVADWNVKVPACHGQSYVGCC
jgi:hypothetical protein